MPYKKSLPISVASIQGVNTLLNHLRQSHARFVFWVRSRDYERQLFVSQSYEAIWKRPCDSLYTAPNSWFDTVVAEDLDRNLKEYQQRQHVEMDDRMSNLAVFRVHFPNGKVQWMKDYSFTLHDVANRVVAVAGFSECIDEAEAIGLLDNPVEKKIESVMMDNFLGALKTDCEVRVARHPYINVMGTAEPNLIYLPEDKVSISAREFDCISHLVQKKTAKEIAKSLAVSPRTVEEHIVKVREKAQLPSSISLIADLNGAVQRCY